MPWDARRRRRGRHGGSGPSAVRLPLPLVRLLPGSVGGRRPTATAGAADMARGAQGQGEPHDWVTRAADDAIRHAHDLYGADHVITCASGASPSGPIHLGQPARVPHRALRGRGDPAPRDRRTPPAQLGRLRPVPQGAGGHRPVLVRAHRPAAVRRPRPVGLPRRPGPSTTRRRSRRSLAELGVEMEEVSQTEQYRAGTYREQILTAVRRRDEIEQVMARYRTKAAPRLPRASRRRPRWPTPSPTTTSPG